MGHRKVAAASGHRIPCSGTRSGRAFAGDALAAAPRICRLSGLHGHLPGLSQLFRLHHCLGGDTTWPAHRDRRRRLSSATSGSRTVAANRRYRGYRRHSRALCRPRHSLGEGVAPCARVGRTALGHLTHGGIGRRQPGSGARLGKDACRCRSGIGHCHFSSTTMTDMGGRVTLTACGSRATPE